jgi:hypothetical protein
MQHRNHMRGSTGVKRFVVTAAVAVAATTAILGTAAMSSSTSHSAQPATVRPAAAQPATVRPATAGPAARPAATPDTALARAFRKFFRHQAASGMTAWLKSGIELRNEAILVQARLDAFPHRDAALPADSAALAASARKGLAHPSPVATARWNKIMRDELTIAQELPIPSEGNAATAEAPVIQQDYLAFAEATS